MTAGTKLGGNDLAGGIGHQMADGGLEGGLFTFTPDSLTTLVRFKVPVRWFESGVAYWRSIRPTPAAFGPKGLFPYRRMCLIFAIHPLRGTSCRITSFVLL